VHAEPRKPQRRGVTPALQKLGIIAGGGELPLRIAEACLARSLPCFVLAVEEFALPIGPHVPSARNPISKLGRAFKMLRQQACRDIVFAGKFERPIGRIRFRPDLTAAWFFVRRVRTFRRGDDNVHRIMADEFARVISQVSATSTSVFDLPLFIGEPRPLLPDPRIPRERLRQRYDLSR